MSLGTNISRLRAEHHLSQGDLAEALEVSRQSVSKWETDSSVPDLDKLVKLSQLFGVSLDELVTGEAGPAAEEAPPETPAAPAAQAAVPGRMPGRKIAGIVLFCMAFLTFLVLTALGGIREGLLLASPFLVCGIICFAAKKLPGLWCAWAICLIFLIPCRYAFGLNWRYICYTFSWQERGLTFVHILMAWVLTLAVLALLTATVLSFRYVNFSPTRQNGLTLAGLWSAFVLVRFLPIVPLILSLGDFVVSMGAVLLLISIVQGIVSLILLAAALTLSVRMIAAWRVSKR